MRKVILGVAVSLDGFIEGPNGEYDWCFADQDYGMSTFFKRIDAMFMGRKSYEVAKTMKGENPWAGIRTYVFSKTLKTLDDPNASVVSGENFEQQILEVTNSPGKDIWLFGGAELTTAFINKGLVDEFWLAVHPLILGRGKPLFQNIDTRKKLVLKESKVYETGLVSLTYAH